ncbi:MAG TPA: hypothetical protein PKC18_02385 [Lacipirellulaceae bacterium]|nr:hypothetical protein [Lacipirellulaceae bacterium]
MSTLNSNLILLADDTDVIKAVGAVIVMILWGVGQFMAARPKAKPAARPRPKPPQPGAPAGGPAKGLSVEEQLRREVEEFMRRAQRRGEGEAPARPMPTAAAPVERSRDRAAQQRRAQAKRPTSPPREQRVRRVEPSGAGVSEHVAEHLTRSSQALSAHAQQLGADVAQADERMDEHLAERFSHKLGTLEPRAADPAAMQSVRSVDAQGLFDMLRKPEGVRRLIVAGEILRRPEERWSRPGDAR